MFLWLTVTMPTGSGKSTKFVSSLVQPFEGGSGVLSDDPAWILDDATFEKLGALMCDNLEF